MWQGAFRIFTDPWAESEDIGLDNAAAESREYMQGITCLDVELQ